MNNIIITGDLNNDPNSASAPYLAGFANLKQRTVHINEPTRITEYTATILDQCLNNMPYFFQDVSVLSSFSDSDHCTMNGKIMFQTLKKYSYKDHFNW